MAFQQSPDWNITPLDALQIYSLKTSPAFEAALFAGLRIAGHPLAESNHVPLFCHQSRTHLLILIDTVPVRNDNNSCSVRRKTESMSAVVTILAAVMAELPSIDSSTSIDLSHTARHLTEGQDAALLPIANSYPTWKGTFPVRGNAQVPQKSIFLMLILDLHCICHHGRLDLGQRQAASEEQGCGGFEDHHCQRRQFCWSLYNRMLELCGCQREPWKLLGLI